MVRKEYKVSGINSNFYLNYPRKLDLSFLTGYLVTIPWNKMFITCTCTFPLLHKVELKRTAYNSNFVSVQKEMVSFSKLHNFIFVSSNYDVQSLEFLLFFMLSFLVYYRSSWKHHIKHVREKK